MKRNISIIGMAGVGKSFTSKALSSKLNYEYISADKLITQEAEKINTNKDFLSDDEFMKLEENVIFSLKDKTNTIIDTGGSVIYSQKAMKILSDISFIVYLFDSLENIKKRFDDRGEPHLIGMTEEKTFKELLSEREKLYKKYADIEINVSEHKDNVVEKILNKYKKYS